MSEQDFCKYFPLCFLKEEWWCFWLATQYTPLIFKRLRQHQEHLLMNSAHHIVDGQPMPGFSQAYLWPPPLKLLSILQNFHASNPYLSLRPAKLQFLSNFSHSTLLLSCQETDTEHDSCYQSSPLVMATYFTLGMDLQWEAGKGDVAKQPNETRAAQHMPYWYLQIQHAHSDTNRHQSHVTNTFMKTNGQLIKLVFICKIVFFIPWYRIIFLL